MRGLQALCRHVCPGGGIIPARAGFTGREAFKGVLEVDHPRACGVYKKPQRFLGIPGGSSPRVRGLHIKMNPRMPPGGIIPARAGFTRSIFPDS